MLHNSPHPGIPVHVCVVWQRQLYSGYNKNSCQIRVQAARARKKGHHGREDLPSVTFHTHKASTSSHP